MNGLVCKEEHQACFRYDGTDCPSIEISDFLKGHYWERTLMLGEIVVVYKGSILLSYDRFLNHRIGEGNILLLPPGSHFKALTDEGVTLFIFRLHDVIRLCENYPINKLKDRTKSLIFSNQLNTLLVTKPIESFLSPLASNLKNGLRCSIYLQQKIQELMILFRAYYEKEDLAVFFSPVLTNTSEFSHFVLQNYRHVKTVKELADLYSCSISSFDKKFRKTFGMAPYKWMQERKVSLIYHEIHATHKPIKQIAEEQQFTSLPQFNDYCKKHFGNPPGKMRKLTAPSMKIGV